MATRLVLGLLPSIDTKIYRLYGSLKEYGGWGDVFCINDKFRIGKIPEGIKSISTFDPLSLDCLSKNQLEEIQNEEWVLVHEYEDPCYNKAGNDEEIRQRDMNLGHAIESIWRFVILAAIKCRTNLFPDFIFLSEPTGNNAWFRQAPRVPVEKFSDEYDFWRDYLIKPQLLKLRELYPVFCKKLNDYRFRYAIIMCREAFLGEYPEDKLLMASIALEVIFKKEGEWKNLKRRIGKRVTSFLKKNSNIQTALEDSYQVRSDIMHGKLNYQDKTTSDILKQTSLTMLKYACQALTQLIENEVYWQFFIDEKKWNKYLQKLSMGVSNPHKEVKNISSE